LTARRCVVTRRTEVDRSMVMEAIAIGSIGAVPVGMVRRG
jgi:hypothetical protein